MKLDKELYRKAHEALQQWSDAKLLYRVQADASLSPQEAWKRYVDLIEFGWWLCPQPSQWQREQKLADLTRYYERLQKFENWRRTRASARPS